MFKPSSKLLTLAALSIATTLFINGCTNSTSRAGQVSYFTEGVIVDIERISLDTETYNASQSAALGGAIGAGVGQVIGKNTKGTLIGAGIGAILGGAGASLSNHVQDGARLTINTSRGMLIVDEPFSCDYRRGTPVRMINHGRNQVQLQVNVNGSYRTVETNSHSDCPVR